jgi:hypothetical protein
MLGPAQSLLSEKREPPQIQAEVAELGSSQIEFSGGKRRQHPRMKDPCIRLLEAYQHAEKVSTRSSIGQHFFIVSRHFQL